jgi:hypothetical protein
LDFAHPFLAHASSKYTIILCAHLRHRRFCGKLFRVEASQCGV